jgi:putative FmdB family regulatory protein
MPIYEFYCEDCNVIFNFLSRTVNTSKKPKCPHCKKKTLSRQVSLFSFTGKAKEDGGLDDLPIDESKMEKAMEALAGEADKINEDDPRQAADLMRKLSDMTGLKLGTGMEEALARMEKGEDPEKIEAEMGDLLEGEEPFELPGKNAGGPKAMRAAPVKDETLYDL